MKKSKLLLVFAAMMLVVSLFSATFAAAPYRVAMVTDVGGLGDKSFNDSAYLGLQNLKKDLGCDIKVVESKKMEDYVPNLKSLADQKYDIVWAIGFLMADAVKEVATMYPNQKFAIIDDSSVKLPNVASVTFKENEGSFLVGVIAGTDTKKKKVGFIGGMEFPLIKKFEAGYMAGVKAVNPKVQIFSAYTGAFDNPSKGKELAQAQFTYGADIIYHASGACGIGVIDAAKEKGKGYWAIGVDQDQFALGARADGSNAVISSMVKRVDVGVYKTSKEAMDGKFPGGKAVELGLAENGVGVSDSSKKTASAKALRKVEQLRKQIIDGKIVVPTDPKAVK